jgi:DNA anti-recombination protein RmuC
VTLYALLQTVPKEPFYTNDLLGVLKLLGTVIVVGGVIGGLIIRLVFNTTVQKQADMQRDIDGLGKRVTEQATQCTQNSTEVRALAAGLARHEGVVSSVVAGHAELKATVEAMRSQSAEQQRDILSAITASAGQFQTALADVRVELAKQGERSNIGKTLAEGFHEIAEIMRERDRNA